MKKSDVLLIGFGQAGNNIVDAIVTESKRRFLGYYINSCADDIEALKGNGNIRNNMFIIPNASGTGRNRKLAKEYVKMHYKNMADEISKGYLMQKAIYIVFSMDGGTGGGGALAFAQILRTVCPNKKINLIAVLPSLELRSKQGKRNVLECWNDLADEKVRKCINTVYFLNNDSRKALDNYEKINLEFAKLFNESFDVCSGDISGTIDPNDSARIHNANGVGVIYMLPDNVSDASLAVKFAKSESLLAEIDDMSCEYLLVSLKNDSKLNIENVIEQFNYKEEVIVGKNKNHSIVMATGLNFDSVKDNIQIIQASLEEDKKIAEIKSTKDEIAADLKLEIENDEQIKEINKDIFDTNGGKSLDELLDDEDLFKDIFS